MTGTEPTARTCDVVVVGGGAVGENVADRAGRTGLEVILVESELVGGECSYWACMPSKALLRPGAVLAAARAVDGAAQAVTGGMDRAAVLARRDGFASHWDDASQVSWLEGAGIELIRGHARVVGPRRVEVTGADGGVSILEAKHAVVLATGSEPVLPDVPGLVASPPWTSREATAVQDIPESLAVIGGGVVAVEMATAFSDLGTRVTLLVRGDRLLSGTEPFAGRAVAAGLVGLGVHLRFSTEVTQVERVDGQVRLTLSDGEPMLAAEVLVAAGRRAATTDLGLEAIGLVPGEPLTVDDSMRVNGVKDGWLYAAGDVTGRVATTHQGKYDARVAGDVVAARFGGQRRAADAAHPWSRYRATADHHAVPQVVFTRPEVATVGLTEAQARAAGYPVRKVQLSLGAVAGAAVSADGYEGTAAMVVDTHREVLLGATFVGPEVAELLHAATVAVVGEVPLDRLWHAVPAYPTVSEIWLRLLEEYGL
ncbi:NAD(P)/FAD-dependent oxidoreductase [Actinotalea sp. K2]|uniref:dihydrolipoyl dehydrogenase family protein n=1 Tax=Actinotalea sp. K2 TaxID=2939438 RepID=UPI002017AE0D|nr:NAD(P)/FAD-dependent oxidoreductase [Actinotalea sp. K2]MCL3860364.1 NAD(P)/FAD-dependent oxidoreductase [Actinotalea sp. K2]